MRDGPPRALALGMKRRWVNTSLEMQTREDMVTMNVSLREKNKNRVTPGFWPERWIHWKCLSLRQEKTVKFKTESEVHWNMQFKMPRQPARHKGLDSGGRWGCRYRLWRIYLTKLASPHLTPHLLPCPEYNSPHHPVRCLPPTRESGNWA